MNSKRATRPTASKTSTRSAKSVRSPSKAKPRAKPTVGVETKAAFKVRVAKYLKAVVEMYEDAGKREIADVINTCRYDVAFESFK